MLQYQIKPGLNDGIAHGGAIAARQDVIVRSKYIARRRE